MKISEIFESLHNVGMSEVMLYLPDGSASRCHWKDTAILNGVRVALVADVDRGIVRVVPLDRCEGIGFPSPKGVDPMGYKAVIGAKLNEVFGMGSIPPAPVEQNVVPVPTAAGPEEVPVTAGVAEAVVEHREVAAVAHEKGEATVLPAVPQPVPGARPKTFTLPNGEAIPATNANAGVVARALLARLNAANLAGRTPQAPQP